MTAVYSILHLLVDGVCAFAMFGYFATWENWYVNILLYNFCAFAMQMPLGVVLDGLNGKKTPFAFAVLGVMLTIIGAVTHPVVLGLGNALFHLGGGVGTIHEDEAKGWQGRGLGVFVAPGALGLYIGTQLAKSGIEPGWMWIVPVGVVMFLGLACGAQMLRRRAAGRIQGTITVGTKEREAGRVQNVTTSGQKEHGADRLEEMAAHGQKEHGVDRLEEMTASGQREQGMDRLEEVADSGQAESGTLWLVIGCVAVVILRSYIGMAISFSWKTTLLAGTVAVLAVVLGKMAGGFSSAGFGMRRTVAVSLGLAAVCYLFSGNMIAGILALFFFNMTMPITLYLLVQRLKELPGFSFGLLTFGLFLGFLPVYFGVTLPVDGRFVGALGSLVSLAILWMCVSVGRQAPAKPCAMKKDLQTTNGDRAGHVAVSKTQEVG